MVSLVTGWTTPFATSSSAWGVALICVLLSSSMNAFPMNWFNAPLVMPARGGLMLDLPYNLPSHLNDDLAKVGAAVGSGIVPSCVIGTGDGFPFGPTKL